MSAPALILILFAVALLSSAITGVVLWLYFKKIVEPRLQLQIAAVLETLGNTVEARVRKGVVAGVTDLAGTEGLKRTGEKVATTGANLMGEGLNLLLGNRPRKK